MRKSFFGQPRTVITSLITEQKTLAELGEKIRSSAEQGADAIAVSLPHIPPEDRTTEAFRRLMDIAPELPFMFTLYRADEYFGADDEARQKFLLRAADAGAEVIDVMGDLFDPEPYELAVKPDAIARQKELIQEIHRHGAKVIMSSHMRVPRTAEEVLAHLQEQSSRGADILKIVYYADTEADFREAIRTFFLLKKELDKPFTQLCSGKFGKLFRYLGVKFGLDLTFAAPEEAPGTLQPSIGQFRAVMDNIDWQPPEI